jgi:protein-S-isoprenylcysteine O-methyltransferase Ste14
MEVPLEHRAEPGPLPRLVFAVAHALIFGLSLWILTGGVHAIGDRLGGSLSLGDGQRRMTLAVCGAVYLLRMRLSVGNLLWRPFGWYAALSSTGLAAVYQIEFALAGSDAGAPMEGWGDMVGLLLFFLGSGLSTGSEFARSSCFEGNQRRSALCTRGLFALVRHPDFLGDLMWGTGWALLTRNTWALAVPLLAAAVYGLPSAAAVERHLEEQEGPMFLSWANKTKRLIPFIY